MPAHPDETTHEPRYRRSVSDRATSDAVRTFGLARLDALRLSRALDRALARGSAGARLALRDPAQLLVRQLADAGLLLPAIVERLERLVAEHATERGWTQLSLLSRAPRYLETATAVAGWAAEELGAVSRTGTSPSLA